MINNIERMDRQGETVSKVEIFQIVPRSFHQLLSQTVGAGIVTAQIRVGNRPTPTKMAHRATNHMHSRISR